MSNDDNKTDARVDNFAKDAGKNITPTRNKNTKIEGDFSKYSLNDRRI